MRDPLKSLENAALYRVRTAGNSNSQLLTELERHDRARSIVRRHRLFTAATSLIEYKCCCRTLLTRSGEDIGRYHIQLAREIENVSMYHAGLARALNNIGSYRTELARMRSQ